MRSVIVPLLALVLASTFGVSEASAWKGQGPGDLGTRQGWGGGSWKKNRAKALKKAYKKAKIKKLAKAKAKLLNALSAEQKEAAKSIKLASTLAKKRAKALLGLGKADLALALFAENPDKKAVDAALANWVAAKKQLMYSKADYFLKKRALFTSDCDKKRFTKLFFKKSKLQKKMQKKLAKKAALRKFALKKLIKKLDLKPGDCPYVALKKAAAKRAGRWGGWQGRRGGEGRWGGKGRRGGEGRWGQGRWGGWGYGAAKAHKSEGGHSHSHKHGSYAHTHPHKHDGSHAHKHDGSHAHKQAGASCGEQSQGACSCPPGECACPPGGCKCGDKAQSASCGKQSQGWSKEGKWGKGKGKWGKGCPWAKGMKKAYKKAMKKRAKRMAKKMAFAITKYQKKKAFYKSLTADQKKLLADLKWNKKRELLPLKARYRLEKAILKSLMMDLNVTAGALQRQIDLVAEAKGAIKSVKLAYYLKFRASLDKKQQLHLAYKKLASWKKGAIQSKRAAKKAHAFWAKVVVKAHHIAPKLKSCQGPTSAPAHK